MSKLNNLKPEIVLACFREETGVHFSKLCNDISSNLGRIEKDVITKPGQWKVGTKGKLVAKDGHTLQLPLNAPWAILLQFGMRANELSQAGSSVEPQHTMEIQCTMPAPCEAWYNENYRKSAKPELVAS